MSQFEINASKSTAFKWFAYNKAFQTTDRKKSYAQALVNAIPVRDQYMKKAENFSGEVTHKILHLQLRSVGGMTKISVPLIQVWLLQVLFHVTALIFPPTKNCKQV